MDLDRRCWTWSKRQTFALTLLMVAVLFFYYIDIKDSLTDWNPSRLWILPVKSHRHDVLSGSNTSTPGPGSEGLTSPALLQTEDTVRTTLTSGTGPETNGSVVTHQMDHKDRAEPAPYKSPGPYFVEYPHEYHYIINEPNSCEQRKPFLVLMVPVAPANKAHRDVIRSTWGSESPVLGKVVQRFFLLGQHVRDGAEQLQQQLLLESREHRDLIQSDFLDCYKNLTIKTMVMLEWLDAYCSHADYAMKIDSDMFLNVHNLVNMLLTAPKTNYMTGRVERTAQVRRDRPSKWFVPVEVYAQSYYPDYTLGLGYILSLDLPRKLVEASRHVKAFYIEDVYLGMCMKHLGIPPTGSPNWDYFHVFPVPYSRCSYSRIIATTTYDNTDRRQLWEDFKRPGPHCP